MDTGHKLIVLGPYMNVLCTPSLSLLSSWLYESSLKDISEQILIQRNCSGNCLIIGKLKLFFFDCRKRLFWTNIIGQVFKNFSTVAFKYGNFSSSIVFSWNCFLLKYCVMIYTIVSNGRKNFNRVVLCDLASQYSYIFSPR